MKSHEESLSLICFMDFDNDCTHNLVIIIKIRYLLINKKNKIIFLRAPFILFLIFNVTLLSSPYYLSNYSLLAFSSWVTILPTIYGILVMSI